MSAVAPHDRISVEEGARGYVVVLWSRDGQPLDLTPETNHGAALALAADVRAHLATWEA